MKFFKQLLMMFSLLFCFILSNGQSVDLASGDLAVLKGEKSINIAFTYDKMSVGEYSREQDYVKYKVDESNKKEAGSGEKWAQEWIADRKLRFEPKFIEIFSKFSDLTYDSTAKYTLVFNTSSTEPGYQIAIKKKPAEIEGTAMIVETANKAKKVAVISVEKGGSGMFKGAAFDSGSRITEAYAGVGKKLGLMVKKAIK